MGVPEPRQADGHAGMAAHGHPGAVFVGSGTQRGGGWRMQLDRGICTVYTQTDISESGGMPRYERRIKAQSYYGELSFETSPQWPTEHREETKTAARVRILQSRGVTKDDVAE